jgi:peptide/nickel transport system substrate-binding protein
MSIFPSLWARVFVAALAVTAVPASFAKTPADQLIVGMSMINLLSLDPAAATGAGRVGDQRQSL